MTELMNWTQCDHMYDPNFTCVKCGTIRVPLEIVSRNEVEQAPREANDRNPARLFVIPKD